MRRVAGVVLLSVPFVGLIAALVADYGWWRAVVMIGVVAVVLACVLGGLSLLMPLGQPRPNRTSSTP
ncbi:hypothetical protein, partial [Planotetraspora phitsanulokensis]